MTQREFYTAVINANVADELKAFAQNSIEKLDTRNERRASTPTKAQKENAIYEQPIINFVNSAEGLVTANAIAEAVGVTIAKASSLAGRLSKEGKIVCKEKALKAVSGKGKVNGYGKITEEVA